MTDYAILQKVENALPSSYSFVLRRRPSGFALSILCGTTTVTSSGERATLEDAANAVMKDVKEHSQRLSAQTNTRKGLS